MLYNLHTHIAPISHQGIFNCYPEDPKPACWYSIGIHPWYINTLKAADHLQIIEQAMEDKHCLAIGECGLDQRIEQPLAQQIVIFEAQLQLAQQYKKPVIVHCVAAFDQLLALKKKWQISVPMVIHGFGKSAELARQLVDAGFYLSFGKNLLKHEHLEVVIRSVPRNKLFLETDMVDVPLEEVYTVAARALDIELDTLADQIALNFNQVFLKNEKVDRTC